LSPAGTAAAQWTSEAVVALGVAAADGLEAAEAEADAPDGVDFEDGGEPEHAASAMTMIRNAARRRTR